MATQNYITTSTPSTSLRPLWTMTRVTRRTTTCATCRIEHTCTLSLVSSFDHSSHSTWLKAVHAFVIPSACHPCAAFFEFLSITFYFSLFFSFLYPFLMTDGDSMTINNLRDSANGTFVTLDDISHFTHVLACATVTSSRIACCPAHSSRYRSSLLRHGLIQDTLLPHVMLAGSCGSPR